MREPEQVRVEHRDLALTVAPHEPARERRQRQRAEHDQQHDVVAAFLPDQDAEHHAAHAQDREDRSDDVEVSVARVRDVLDELDLRQDDRDHDHLEQEPDAPGQVGRQEPPEERPDRRGDRRRRSHERIGLLLSGPLEVAVDQRLHRRQQQRGAQAADDRPEDHDRRDALRHGHRQRADRVGQEAQDVRPLAADQIADLAVDQDERRRDERLERDRGLDRAHRRAEIVNDL